MTKTEKARQELADMGVQVFPCPMQKHGAVASPDGWLGLGEGQSEQETHTVLTHEKWHYKLGAFYRVDAPFDERLRKEAAVRRAALRELVPKNQLASLLRSGLRPHEVAEVLEVTEAQIWEAWRYYRDEDARYCAEAAKE